MEKWTREKADLYEENIGHCIFGPSGSSRYLKCTASIPMTLQYATEKPLPPSSYAAEGTYLHSVMETLGRYGWAKVEERYPSLFSYDEEKLEWVKSAYEYLRNLTKDMVKYDIHIEKTGSLIDFKIPDVYGTADVVVIDYVNRVAHIIDWKFGRGIFVSSVNNSQLKCYGGIAVGYPSTVDKLELHIVQPPLNNFNSWEILYENLVKWIRTDLLAAVHEAKSDNPTFAPSVETCRWCSHKSNCKARHDEANKTAQDVFAAIAEVKDDPERVSVAQWSELYGKVCEIAAMKSDIEEQLTAAIRKGTGVPGYKLVPGKLSRKFSDTTAVEKYARDNMPAGSIHLKKLISPAQFEKAWPNHYGAIKHLVKETRNPTLVPESDKREALKPEEL